MLHRAHAQAIRAELSRSSSLSGELDETDMIAAYQFDLFLHNPHGEDAIFLSLSDKEGTRSAVLQLNKTIIRQIVRDYGKLEKVLGLLKRSG